MESSAGTAVALQQMSRVLLETKQAQSASMLMSPPQTSCAGGERVRGSAYPTFWTVAGTVTLYFYHTCVKFSR